ncbi:WD repeat and coiled-coil-containing protein [Prionailurus iriomotensis]
MELGKGRLLRTGLNALYQAVHPLHGLVWTNGNQVVLTDLQLHSGEARFGDSEVIGQFEHVYGVSWAPPGTADMPALLAVQHKKRVIVWQLCPSSTGTNKRLMSQTCEIRESLPVLPQGCVWHPESAVLAVLTAQRVSVFHSVHCDSSRVNADIDTQGLIHCASWTQDGQRLVVAAGSSLHSYIWDSAQKTLRRCSFHPVFDVDSSVRSIRATVDSQVAVATELPLDKICGLNASEIFDVPPSGEDPCLCTFPVIDEVPTTDPLDLTHMHFNTSKSEGSSLICLRKKDYLTGTGMDSSHLVLVTFEKEVTQTRKVTIPGILVPDLITFDLKAQVVAVASNTSNIIFIYSVIRSFIPNIQQIQLEKSERPKAFLPSSKTDQYIIRLIVREVTLEKELPVTSSENQSGYSTFSTPLSKIDRKKLLESLSPDLCHQNRGLFTSDSRSQCERPGRTLIEEIRSPPSSICDGSIALRTLDAEPVNRSVTPPRSSSTPDHTSAPEPPNLPQSKNSQKEKETYRLSKEMEILSRTLTEVQRCLSELTDALHNGKKSSPVYPLSRDLPYVHITYQVTSPLRSYHYTEKLLQPVGTARKIH